MVVRLFQKRLGIVLLLGLIMGGCAVDSAESRQREAVHQLDDVLTLRQKNIELSAP
jgi:hypothetical protein